MAINIPRAGRIAGAPARPDARVPEDHRGPAPVDGVVNMRPAFQRNVNERSLSRAHGSALAGGVIGAVLGLVFALAPGPLQTGGAYGAFGYAIVLGLAAAAAGYGIATAVLPREEEMRDSAEMRRRVDARIRDARSGDPRDPATR